MPPSRVGLFNHASDGSPPPPPPSPSPPALSAHVVAERQRFAAETIMGSVILAVLFYCCCQSCIHSTWRALHCLCSCVCWCCGKNTATDVQEYKPLEAPEVAAEEVVTGKEAMPIPGPLPVSATVYPEELPMAQPVLQQQPQQQPQPQPQQHLYYQQQQPVPYYQPALMQQPNQLNRQGPFVVLYRPGHPLRSGHGFHLDKSQPLTLREAFTCACCLIMSAVILLVLFLECDGHEVCHVPTQISRAFHYHHGGIQEYYPLDHSPNYYVQHLLDNSDVKW